MGLGVRGAAPAPEPPPPAPEPPPGSPRPHPLPSPSAPEPAAPPGLDPPPRRRPSPGGRKGGTGRSGRHRAAARCAASKTHRRARGRAEAGDPGRPGPSISQLRREGRPRARREGLGPAASAAPPGPSAHNSLKEKAEKGTAGEAAGGPGRRRERKSGAEREGSWGTATLKWSRVSKVIRHPLERFLCALGLGGPRVVFPTGVRPGWWCTAYRDFSLKAGITPPQPHREQTSHGPGLQLERKGGRTQRHLLSRACRKTWQTWVRILLPGGRTRGELRAWRGGLSFGVASLGLSTSVPGAGGAGLWGGLHWSLAAAETHFLCKPGSWEDFVELGTRFNAF